MGKETATKPSSAKTPGKQKSTSRHTASPEAANSQGLHLALSNPLSASSEQIAQLQRQYGNRAVQRLIQRAQARVQREAAIGLEGGEVSANEVGGDLQSQINSAQGGGQPLDKTVGSQIGSALGSDFSNVHVHTDAQSDSLNRSLSATAFTTGSDIFFSQGAYNPGTHSGKQLLTHELTHVVQQGGGAPTALKANKVQTKLTVGPAGDKYEEEADQVASQVMRMPARQAGLRLQRHVVSAAIQRKIMDVDEFKTATSTRRRGGYIKDVDKVLGRYHANPTPATLTALRFALEKYLATKGDGSDEKATQARQLLAQVMEEEQTLSPKDQMEGLLPYKNDIVAMAAKGKLLKKLDAKLTGANKYVREDLKKAIIESPKTPEVLEAKVAAINLDGGKDPIVKLAKELSKGSNPGKAAIYHSLYARCVEMASTAFGEHEAYQDFAESMKDTPELKDLVKPIIDVTRIFAEAFDLSYHKKKTQQRDMAQAEVTGSGGTPLNVVVMGAGPVGMIAAMEAHLAGANVHVYEMRRTTPNRANVLKLTDPTMHKLRRIGVYSDLFGPDNPRGEDSLARGHGISVGLLEDVLRTKAAQMGIRVTYGYELETITAPDEEGGKTRVRLKKYVPTRSGPEMDLYEKLKDQPDYLDATSDLVIGATGAGGSTRAKLGLESERRSGEEGEEYIDFTAVGIFAADNGTASPPGADKERDNAWVVGLRTPVVDYLLTQITREQFLRFKDDKTTRDAWVLDRGQKVTKYTGALKQSSVFDITLNQAKKVVSEESSGILIGDEAATPHPLTGSGFNTGSSTTNLVSGLVRGLAKGNRQEAFTTYSSGVKKRTDKMVGTGAKFFEKNIAKLTKMNKLPEPPPPEPEVSPSEEEAPRGGTYQPEDIGIGPGSEEAYERAYQQVAQLYGLPPERRRSGTYEPEDIGIGPDSQEAYERAYQKVRRLFTIPEVEEVDE